MTRPTRSPTRSASKSTSLLFEVDGCNGCSRVVTTSERGLRTSTKPGVGAVPHMVSSASSLTGDNRSLDT